MPNQSSPKVTKEQVLAVLAEVRKATVTGTKIAPLSPTDVALKLKLDIFSGGDRCGRLLRALVKEGKVGTTGKGGYWAL